MRFEDLDVWKRSARLSADIYKALKDLRDYGFRDQITRSGLSIPSNIAEGIERVSAADCIKFLLYSKGSCGELRTQVYIGMDIDYIDREVGKKWISETEAISSMLGGLIRAKAKARDAERQEKPGRGRAEKAGEAGEAGEAGTRDAKVKGKVSAS